jgi:xylose dehydrogenase (NAD/NADP)
VKLRCGILGAGRFLEKATQAVRASRHAELVAVASQSKERSPTSYEALCADPNIDFIWNISPNWLHGRTTMAALSAKKHVLCEKPLGLSAREVDEMFAAARANQRFLAEGFMHRFHPQIAVVHENLEKIGSLRLVRVSFTAEGRCEPENFRWKREFGGGTLSDLGCYAVNWCRMLAKSEPISARASQILAPNGDVDGIFAGILVFPNGILGELVTSYRAFGTYFCEIVGERGSIFVPHARLPPQWPAEIFVRVGKTETAIRVGENEPTRPSWWPYAAEVDAFCEAILENRRPILPPDSDAETDAKGNARAMDMLRAAAGIQMSK